MIATQALAWRQEPLNSEEKKRDLLRRILPRISQREDKGLRYHLVIELVECKIAEIHQKLLRFIHDPAFQPSKPPRRNRRSDHEIPYILTNSQHCIVWEDSELGELEPRASSLDSNGLDHHFLAPSAAFLASAITWNHMVSTLTTVASWFFKAS